MANDLMMIGLLVLRVVGHLPMLGVCHELGRQVSDKPQGRKLREVQARYFGKHGLWDFEGWATGLAGCEAVLVTLVWCVDALRV